MADQQIEALKAMVERLNAAAREQFEAATHNAKVCNELRAKLEQQKRRADNHWETLRSIREFAREGDCERIVLWVNDAGSGYVETAEETLGVWIDRAQSAEAREAQLRRALSWLAANQNCELSFDYGDADEDGKGWCVHRVNGGVNDREWTLVGNGPTPLCALEASVSTRS